MEGILKEKSGMNISTHSAFIKLKIKSPTLLPI